jgi:hypothetical protein
LRRSEAGKSWRDRGPCSGQMNRRQKGSPRT